MTADNAESQGDVRTRSILLIAFLDSDLRRNLSRAATSHPGLTICLFGPGKQMPGELLLWYVPLSEVLAFAQPADNLFRGSLVVDFGND
jgi:hypothetical protein